ncbi:MAG: hypothetical protein AAFR33_13500, partial [Pseudomonadota bacterium]
ADRPSSIMSSTMPIEDDIQKRGREGTAIGMVDDMMDEGLSASEMRERIRAIQDSELRQMVERRRDYAVRERDARELEAQEAVFEKYGDMIWTGELTSVTNIPRAERGVLTQSQINSMDVMIRRQASGDADATTDFATYDQVISLLEVGDAGGALSALRSNLDRFSRSDAQSLRRMIASGRGEEGATSGSVDVLRSRLQIIDQNLRQAGLADKDGGIDPAMRGAIDAELDRRAQAWQVENGKDEVPEAWVQEQAGILTRDIILTRDNISWWPGENKVTRPRGAPMLRGDGIPPEYQAAVVAAYPDMDTASEPQLEQAYDLALRTYRDAGIMDPTPEEITAMITSLRGAGE